MREVRNADGRLAIADEAIASLVAIAATACPGVAGMASRSLQDGLADILGRENPVRGVEVDLSGDELSLVLDIHVVYGLPIADVVQDVVASVRRAVEGLAGISLTRCEVRVQGVRRRS